MGIHIAFSAMKAATLHGFVIVTTSCGLRFSHRRKRGTGRKHMLVVVVEELLRLQRDGGEEELGLYFVEVLRKLTE